MSFKQRCHFIFIPWSKECKIYVRYAYMHVGTYLQIDIKKIFDSKYSPLFFFVPKRTYLLCKKNQFIFKSGYIRIKEKKFHMSFYNNPKASPRWMITICINLKKELEYGLELDRKRSIYRYNRYMTLKHFEII